MPITPAIAIHLAATLAATAIGPIALWTRLGRQPRPRPHQAAGYAWVTLMVIAAISALFIRDFARPNLAGYSWIHLLIPFTLGQLLLSWRALRRGNLAAHRKTMQGLYVGACLIAGALALLPGRLLGSWLWA
ncbi:MAG: hypothetical protein A2486_09110 [Burkholderiales bacterium RIFOXYC12_FULL_65_23]|jgi:uncharacterized membrane protein|uniref:DUF2306 domain-containing protein n=1 Tax=Malikia spinosa TaxID=86180 RepID=UPI0008AAD2FA|nr:DUF2306 domain-containing protein [Malikia spinosa]OGB71100.1 MAG: hypothetical protein A2486_09110 [Burkholderiales bacterium RIFOXYC12_FULL_65_23]